jgi:hypothetical protein
MTLHINKDPAMTGADYIAVATQQPSHGRVQEALVSRGAEAAIICSRTGNGWEPLFAIVDKQVKSLPSCYALDDEATEELNRLVESVEGSPP